MLPRAERVLPCRLKDPCCLTLWPWAESKIARSCLMDSVGQEQGIVPSAPALLHIHTTRAESNKRGLRRINCLTWEKRLNVARHGPTMLLLWERGGKLLRFHTWCARRGWIYIRVNVNVGWAAPRGLHFYVLHVFLVFFTVLTPTIPFCLFFSQWHGQRWDGVLDVFILFCL